MRYHISRNGEVKPCKAKTPESCPLGGNEEHFSTKAEAQKFVDAKMEKEYGIVKEAPKNRFALQSSANDVLMSMKSTSGPGRVYVSDLFLDEDNNVKEISIDYSVPASSTLGIDEITSEEYDGMRYIDKNKAPDKYNAYIESVESSMSSNFSIGESDKFTATMSWDVYYEDPHYVKNSARMTIIPTEKVHQDDIEDFMRSIVYDIRISGAEFMKV